MAIELRWLGHGSWSFESGEHRVLLDPFVSDSPTAPCTVDELTADSILVSHGHFDHVADVASIAKRCDATVYANYEVASWFSAQHQLEKTVGMNLGGGMATPFGHLKMVNAVHSSQLPDGSYGGNPAGFVITIESTKIYFACDTALFGDMALIGELGIDLAVVPIGDLFTMGPEDSISAIKLLNPRMVLPAHYNTWPPIEQNAEQWASQVESETNAKPIVLQPGETHVVEAKA